MLEYCLGVLSVFLIYALYHFSGGLLEARESRIRAKLLKKQLETLREEARNIQLEKCKSMMDILANPAARKFYDSIPSIIDTMVKRRASRVEIPSGLSLDAQLLLLKELIISIEYHILSSDRSLDQ